MLFLYRHFILPVRVRGGTEIRALQHHRDAGHRRSRRIGDRSADGQNLLLLPLLHCPRGYHDVTAKHLILQRGVLQDGIQHLLHRFVLHVRLHGVTLHCLVVKYET